MVIVISYLLGEDHLKVTKSSGWQARKIENLKKDGKKRESKMQTMSEREGDIESD